MAYLETVISQIVGTLQENGVTAYAEYELQTSPVPADPMFVTAAVTRFEADVPPVAVYGDGKAFPAVLTLRFRIHGKPNDDPDKLTIIWEVSVLPELMDAGYCIRSAKLGEVQYSRQLDRILREATVTVDALLTRKPLPE